MDLSHKIVSICGSVSDNCVVAVEKHIIFKVTNDEITKLDGCMRGDASGLGHNSLQGYRFFVSSSFDCLNVLCKRHRKFSFNPIVNS